MVLTGPMPLGMPESLPPPTFPAGEVSVVVATRDRPRELAACLEALKENAPDVREVVVCDSASSDAWAVAEVAETAGSVLVRADRPGLSLARNTGAARASGSVIAFLDDDCRVEASWLDGIRSGFTDDRVAAVTGGFLPEELKHEAQVLFLRYSQMDRRGFAPKRFTRGTWESKHWPLDSWRMGSGGNMAVRAETFRKLGGFRLDLGLGTPARGGEDLFLLWSIVRSGGDVVYRPDAMVSHLHHRDLASLHRVMSGYGVGHRAYLAAARAAGAPAMRVYLYAASVVYDRAKRAIGAALTGDGARLELVRRELRGLLGWERA
jgi:GT2 family glycosyltransferase